MNNKLNQQVVTFSLPESLANLRLDQALSQHFPQYSRTQIKTWLAQGDILMNGQIVAAKTKVKGGEEISFKITPPKQLNDVAQDIPLNIVFEDDDILIIDKPVGLIVHPGAGNKDQTLLNALLHYHAPLSHLPRAGICHRLDKDTSGLLMIAKNENAFKLLTKQLTERTLQREYQAIVYGQLISGGKVSAPIARHPINRKRMSVHDEGKSAITHYRVTERFRYHTHLTIRLETGRTHQIRVHMAHIRHPIIGDPLYGGRVKLGKNMSNELIEQLRTFKRQALHAYALQFIHPSTSETIRVTSNLPDDMTALLFALRHDKEHMPQ